MVARRVAYEPAAPIPLRHTPDSYRLLYPRAFGVAGGRGVLFRGGGELMGTLEPLGEPRAAGMAHNPAELPPDPSRWRGQPWLRGYGLGQAVRDLRRPAGCREKLR